MRRWMVSLLAAFLLGSAMISLDAQGAFWTLINGRLTTRNPVAFATGSATAPSVSFTGDPDVGFYSVANNFAGLATNGSLSHLWGPQEYRLGSAGQIGWSANANPTLASADTVITRVAAGQFGWTAIVFANLGTPANGTFAYCSDCTIASPCAGSGTGALAKRLNGVWVCN